MKRSISVRLVGAGIALIAVSIFAATKAAAQCDVDQSNIATPTINLAAVFSTQQFSQTFTVGADGVLCEVSMYVDRRGTPAADLVVEVQGVSGGFPDGNVLASASLSPGTVIDGLNTFDVSGDNLLVAAGDTFAIVLRSTAVLGNDYLAREVPGNLYANGQANINTGSGWTTFGTVDQGFDAIFDSRVSPDVLPEQADLQLGMSATKSAAKGVTTISYTVTVTNNGPDDAANVVVSDPLPSTVAFVSASANSGSLTTPSAGQTGTVTWSAGNVLNGNAAAAQIRVTVAVKGNVNITNIASVTSDTEDPNLANNSASGTVSTKGK